MNMITNTKVKFSDGVSPMFYVLYDIEKERYKIHADCSYEGSGDPDCGCDGVDNF